MDGYADDRLDVSSAATSHREAPAQLVRLVGGDAVAVGSARRKAENKKEESWNKNTRKSAGEAGLASLLPCVQEEKKRGQKGRGGTGRN